MMFRCLPLMILLLGGCSVALPVSESALCDWTELSRALHAEALLEDGGPKSVATGATVLGQFDAACNP